VSSPANELRTRILELVEEFHDAQFANGDFRPGESSVPYAGRVFDSDELLHLVDASLDFWLTTGRYAQRFERELARFLGLRHALLCNSGSSANLLALTALTSPKLGDRALQPGDEVITVAAGFPTTVNPIVLNRLVPVFVDVTLPTYNIDLDQLEAAVGPRTRAIMVAHTLGNPFDVDRVLDVAKRHGLWLVEDNCDGLGSSYKGTLTGGFGHVSTLSFYPAHHITMGEGGCVLTNRPELKTLIESFRDWGRDCWCEPGEDGTCGKRFGWQLGTLPHGYDHKYIFSHIGYNLKLTDMQAAVGLAQLAKLPSFIEAELAAPAGGARAVRGVPRPARGDARHGPQLVRADPDGAEGRAVHAQRAGRPPRGRANRDAASVRRQPHAAACVPGRRASCDRRPREPRRDHEPRILDRLLSGARRAAHRVHAHVVRGLPHRPTWLTRPPSSTRRRHGTTARTTRGVHTATPCGRGWMLSSD
jgi:dTDP-4-amino-4,6-dideoxygalactose transaminase